MVLASDVWVQRYPKATFSAGLLAGFLAGRQLARVLWNFSSKNESYGEGADYQFTGAFPRETGAKNAVIGGHPEDMNAMPASEEPERDGPIHDGSKLAC